jgi:hypothetical protein
MESRINLIIETQLNDKTKASSNNRKKERAENWEGGKT